MEGFFKLISSFDYWLDYMYLCFLININNLDVIISCVLPSFLKG